MIHNHVKVNVKESFNTEITELEVPKGIENENDAKRNESKRNTYCGQLSEISTSNESAALVFMFQSRVFRFTLITSLVLYSNKYARHIYTPFTNQISA